MHSGNDIRRSHHRLVIFGVLTLVLGTLVMTAGKSLELDDKTSMELFLEGGARQHEILKSWGDHGVKSWAALLLLGDTLFLLVYTPFLITLSGRLWYEIKQDFGQTDYHFLWQLLPTFAVLSSLILFILDLLENGLGIAAIIAGPSSNSIGILHSAKYIFIGLVLLLQGLLLLAWYFPATWESVEAHIVDRLDERARLRVAAADIVWRSRYVLFALTIFGGLTLTMDQSRDVLVGMAQALQENGEDRPSWFSLIAGFVVNVLAVWFFAFTCWLWARIACVMQRPDDDIKCSKADCPKNRTEDKAESRDTFAKWWGHLLGATPFLMLTWMCGLAAQAAVRTNATETALLLLWFGAVPLLIGLISFWGVIKDWKKDELNYDCVTHKDTRNELWSTNYRFLLWIPGAPVILPGVALLLLEVTRYWTLSENSPPLPLAIIAFALTFWTGLLGLLAQAALRKSVPWVLGLMLMIGFFGILGLTDNHRVWHSYPGGPANAAYLLGTMYWYQLALAILVAFAMGLVVLYIRNPNWSGKKARWITTLSLIGVTFVILDHADNHLQPSTRTEAAQSPQSPPSLDKAISQWLSTQYDNNKKNLSSPVTVYFVSAEGGGIRSAYWTALVLANLAKNDKTETFPKRIFSLSGVSGGAVGETVWRSCLTENRIDQTVCVKEFGKADLLSPLLSAWMFEDTLARAIPTAWCKLPGCGLLSRGNWFERRLEKATRNKLAEPMVSSTQADVPHLFLNSTWMETGERAIASTVKIDPQHFPTAHDQIKELGSDMPLSTAAHNAARFPYINAIGSMVTAAGKCDEKLGNTDKSGNKQGGTFISKLFGNKKQKCGHLADGGYFDNSGAHTTGDILRAFQTCLFSPDNPCRLGPDERVWARKNLVPQAIQIRSGILDDDTGNDPAQPRQEGRWELYTDIFGPLIAAFNAIGTGSNGRVAESLLSKQIEFWRNARLPNQDELGSSAEIKTPKPVLHCDLKKKGTLYPLGWYLSETAREGMEQAAKSLPLSCQL
jgi:hypothetical protein